MKISTRSRYGLRMMVRLASQYGKGSIELKYISKEEGISLKYLGQIAISLKAASLIQTTRGVNGGHMLSKDPKLYTLLEIIEAIEGKINIIDCVDNPDSCIRESICSTRSIWADLNNTIREKLREKKLSDLLKECERMNGILNYTI